MNEDFKLLRGFDNRQTDERTDIFDCRVAFGTENEPKTAYSTLKLVPGNCTKVIIFSSSGLVKTQQKDGNVFPLMQTIITKLQSFEHLLSGYKKVTENDIFRFFQNDINHCRDLNSEIQILSNQLKSVL